jgi:hypothetical protein
MEVGGARNLERPVLQGNVYASTIPQTIRQRNVRNYQHRRGPSIVCGRIVKECGVPRSNEMYRGRKKHTRNEKETVVTKFYIFNGTEVRGTRNFHVTGFLPRT